MFIISIYQFPSHRCGEKMQGKAESGTMPGIHNIKLNHWIQVWMPLHSISASKLKKHRKNFLYSSLYIDFRFSWSQQSWEYRDRIKDLFCSSHCPPVSGHKKVEVITVGTADHGRIFHAIWGCVQKLKLGEEMGTGYSGWWCLSSLTTLVWSSPAFLDMAKQLPADGK